MVLSCVRSWNQHPHAGEIASVLENCVYSMKNKWEEIGCNLQDSFLKESLMEYMQIRFSCDYCYYFCKQSVILDMKLLLIIFLCSLSQHFWLLLNGLILFFLLQSVPFEPGYYLALPFSTHVYPALLNPRLLQKMQGNSVVNLNDLNSLYKYSTNLFLVLTYKEAYLYKAHATWLSWKLLFKQLIVQNECCSL